MVWWSVNIQHQSLYHFSISYNVHTRFHGSFISSIQCKLICSWFHHFIHGLMYHLHPILLFLLIYKLIIIFLQVLMENLFLTFNVILFADNYIHFYICFGRFSDEINCWLICRLSIIFIHGFMDHLWLIFNVRRSVVDYSLLCMVWWII